MSDSDKKDLHIQLFVQALILTLRENEGIVVKDMETEEPYVVYRQQDPDDEENSLLMIAPISDIDILEGEKPEWGQRIMFHGDYRFETIDPPETKTEEKGDVLIGGDPPSKLVH